MVSLIWFVNMYNIFLFRILMNYIFDVGNFNLFLLLVNDVFILVNRIGFLFFMINSLRMVMIIVIINKRSFRMLKVCISLN